MNRRYLIVGTVTFVIALAVGIVIGSQLVSPQLGPKSDIAVINAHECRADGTCETNSIQSKNLEGEKDVGYSCVDRKGNVYRSEIKCSVYDKSLTRFCSGFNHADIPWQVIDLSTVDRVVFREGERIFDGTNGSFDHVVIPNHFLKLKTVANDTSRYENSVVNFQDKVTGEDYFAVIKSDGRGEIEFEPGEGIYELTYVDDVAVDGDEHVTFLEYPDTRNGGKMDLSLCF